MRKPDPQSAKRLWEDAFLRILLTKRPELRWRVNTAFTDALYETGFDPARAVSRYLEDV